MRGEINLDRFSRPSVYEDKWYLQDDDIIYEIEKVTICAGCGKVIYEDDPIVDSQYWEDDYMHDDKDCIENYYRNAKDPFAANKRVG